jgi:hypothetical protein
VRDLGASNVGLVKSGAGLFDPLNPTGRFSLDLAQPFDRAIIDMHKSLDKQDEASKINNFLSVTYNGRAVELGESGDIQDWPVPDSGTLAYDYVSGKRMPRDARAQRALVFESFLHDMTNMFAADFERLVHLRAACVAHYFTCAQAAEILSLFTYTQRCDALAVMFRRIVDSQNFGHTIWKLLSPAERLEARARLNEALAPFLPESEKVRPSVRRERRARKSMPSHVRDETRARPCSRLALSSARATRARAASPLRRSSSSSQRWSARRRTHSTRSPPSSPRRGPPSCRACAAPSPRRSPTSRTAQPARTRTRS